MNADFRLRNVNIADITSVGKEVIGMLADYHNAPHREMLIDPALFAYIKGRFGHIERQHYVYRYGSKKPKRIDFRMGGHNPVVIEFAVRPPIGGGTLLGSQNVSELRKLCRVSATQARLRALLLLDLYHTPYDFDTLRDTYERISSGRGNFMRAAVRVIYVHAKADFNFLWQPYSAVR